MAGQASLAGTDQGGMADGCAKVTILYSEGLPDMPDNSEQEADD